MAIIDRARSVLLQQVASKPNPRYWAVGTQGLLVQSHATEHDALRAMAGLELRHAKTSHVRNASWPFTAEGLARLQASLPIPGGSGLACLNGLMGIYKFLTKSQLRSIYGAIAQPVYELVRRA